MIEIGIFFGKVLKNRINIDSTEIKTWKSIHKNLLNDKQNKKVLVNILLF